MLEIKGAEIRVLFTYKLPMFMLIYPGNKELSDFT